MGRPSTTSGFDEAQQAAGYGDNSVSYPPTATIGEECMGSPTPSGFDGAQQAAGYGDNNVIIWPPTATIGETNMGRPPTPPGFDGAQQCVGYGASKVSNPPTESSMQLPNLILRSIAVVTTLLGAIVMGATKQTVIIGGVTVTLKTTGTGHSELEYFIAANCIAFVYLAASLAVTVGYRGPSAKRMKGVIAMVDLIMVGFVSSAVGAAAAFSVYLRDQDQVCDIVGRYCKSVAAAIAMSTLGATALLALVMVVLLANLNN